MNMQLRSRVVALNGALFIGLRNSGYVHPALHVLIESSSPNTKSVIVQVEQPPLYVLLLETAVKTLFLAPDDSSKIITPILHLTRPRHFTAALY